MRIHVAVVLGTTFIIASLFLASSCGRQGPAEEAGKKVDQTVEKMTGLVKTPDTAEKTAKELDRPVTDQHNTLDALSLRKPGDLASDLAVPKQEQSK